MPLAISTRRNGYITFFDPVVPTNGNTGSSIFHLTKPTAIRYRLASAALVWC